MKAHIGIMQMKRLPNKKHENTLTCVEPESWVVTGVGYVSTTDVKEQESLHLLVHFWPPFLAFERND